MRCPDVMEEHRHGRWNPDHLRGTDSPSACRSAGFVRVATVVPLILDEATDTDP
ncbi:MAG: hypothetical protein F2840_15045 [Actinobacteria bacterium]|nr:hypothetical protein [Actinomycetota bacterium]